MTRLAARVSVATVALVLMFAAAPALATQTKRPFPDTPKGALDDCGAGNYPLKGTYTIKVLETALAHLSTSDAEYSTCDDALQAAIRADERSSRPSKPSKPSKPPTRRAGTHSGHGTTPPTGGKHHHPRKRTPTKTTEPISQRISAAESQGSQPQVIHGVDYTPGTVTAHGSSLLSSIPTPILAVLAALIACLGAIGALAIRNVVRARRTT